MAKAADPVLNVKVKADGRKIQVYKIKNSDDYNIYLGDGISMEKVAAGAHTETFKADQLEFI